MAPIASHRDLQVWQRGMDLVVAIYALSKDFPADERYRLTQQITRAAVAVPANLAEGHARATRRDYAHFVSMARGSLMEVETYVMIAQRLGFGAEARPREDTGRHHRTGEDADRAAPAAPGTSNLRRTRTTLSPIPYPLSPITYPLSPIPLPMTIKVWLDNAIGDADRRGMAGLRPLLEALARSTSALRTADWNADATGEPTADGGPDDAGTHGR